jgi:hypothetical protein
LTYLDYKKVKKQNAWAKKKGKRRRRKVINQIEKLIM